MSFDQNKEVVRRFNIEVVQGQSRSSFEELMSDQFINHSAPAGAPKGPESMWNTFHNVLAPALSGMRVLIHQQVAEGEFVTTRKAITGKHTGFLFGIDATNKDVSIDVIDIVRVQNGQYIEHWGINTLSSVLMDLRKA